MILHGSKSAPTRASLANEVHVWTARPREFQDGDALSRYRGWLDEEERARADRYLRAEDRHLFLIAHALRRYALSQYADLRPEGWRFTVGEYGRPRIADEIPVPRLGFSLSHTPGFVACAISEEIDCGVDVEEIGRVADPRGLARRYFSKSEQAALDLVADSDIDARFVELWCLKEAYVKARGLGLELPLDRFDFRIDAGGRIEATFDASIEDRDDAWKFARSREGSAHALAFAVRRRPGTDRGVVRFDAREQRP